jgi:hypothetical protein
MVCCMISELTHKNVRCTISGLTHKNDRCTISELTHKNDRCTISELTHENVRCTISGLTHENVRCTISGLTHKNVRCTISGLTHKNVRCTISELTHLSYNGPFASVTITTKNTTWWWHTLCAQTCCRIDNAWKINLVHVKLVSQTKHIDVAVICFLQMFRFHLVYILLHELWRCAPIKPSHPTSDALQSVIGVW